MIKSILTLIRPSQWAKNVFIFVPLFFSHQITDLDKLAEAFWAFVSFSLLASVIYCFNDLQDVEADRNHPRKCHRPLASGALSKNVAVVVMLVLFGVASLIVGLTLSGSAAPYILALYFLMNLAYTLRLKHYAIIDVFIIAIGFVLRLAAGGVATGVSLSHWIVLMTFLLAIFIAFAKRRDDVLIYEETGVKARRNIARYNMTFLNSVLSLISAVAIVCYIMYTVSDEVTTRFGTQYLYLTAIFVIAGVLRYAQLTQVDDKSGSPTKILYTDRFIQFVILGWILSFALIIYV